MKEIILRGSLCGHRCRNELAKLLETLTECQGVAFEGSQNTLSDTGQMSVNLLQFLELEQTWVEYGSSNACCYNVFIYK